MLVNLYFVKELYYVEHSKVKKIPVLVLGIIIILVLVVYLGMFTKTKNSQISQNIEGIDAFVIDVINNFDNTKGQVSVTLKEVDTNELVAIAKETANKNIIPMLSFQKNGDILTLTGDWDNHYDGYIDIEISVPKVYKNDILLTDTNFAYNEPYTIERWKVDDTGCFFTGSYSAN